MRFYFLILFYLFKSVISWQMLQARWPKWNWRPRRCQVGSKTETDRTDLTTKTSQWVWWLTRVWRARRPRGVGRAWWPRRVR